ncbi:hypothetical protein NECID01_0733 [Nematocida sp. AWRm77]|nr:hypothetical protein NECID01_0733 [Nematocida sp. AWRm77]
MKKLYLIHFASIILYLAFAGTVKGSTGVVLEKKKDDASTSKKPSLFSKDGVILEWNNLKKEIDMSTGVVLASAGIFFALSFYLAIYQMGPLVIHCSSWMGSVFGHTLIPEALSFPFQDKIVQSMSKKNLLEEVFKALKDDQIFMNMLEENKLSDRLHSIEKATENYLNAKQDFLTGEKYSGNYNHVLKVLYHNRNIIIAKAKINPDASQWVKDLKIVSSEGKIIMDSLINKMFKLLQHIDQIGLDIASQQVSNSHANKESVFASKEYINAMLLNIQSIYSHLKHFNIDIENNPQYSKFLDTLFYIEDMKTLQYAINADKTLVSPDLDMGKLNVLISDYIDLVNHQNALLKTLLKDRKFLERVSTIYQHLHHTQ